MQITVAIPCYNGARFIEATVQSVLAQSLPPAEVLVIDDGSTDNSAEIARQLPVTVVQHPQNLGLSAARNTAFQAARHAIIAYIDVDAYADREWLAALAQWFALEDVSGVGGQGIEMHQLTLADIWRQLHASQGHGQKRLERAPFLFGLNMAYRVTSLWNVGGFDTALRTNAEDMDIGYRLNNIGVRLVYEPRSRVLHQRTDDERSLKRTMYNWYYWAFIVKHRNGRNPWALALGTMRRALWYDTMSDLVLLRSPGLARLDVEMTRVKLQAIAAAARHSRHIGARSLMQVN